MLLDFIFTSFLLALAAAQDTCDKQTIPEIGTGKWTCRKGVDQFVKNGHLVFRTKYVYYNHRDTNAEGEPVYRTRYVIPTGTDADLYTRTYDIPVKGRGVETLSWRKNHIYLCSL